METIDPFSIQRFSGNLKPFLPVELGTIQSVNISGISISAFGAPSATTGSGIPDSGILWPLPR